MNKRGNPKHGGHGTLTYARWKSMMQRCYTTTAANDRVQAGGASPATTGSAQKGL